MLNHIRPAVSLLLVFTMLTGVVYPLLVTLLAQLCCEQQAKGSLLHNPQGQVIGSRLIGQYFDDPGYFWGRPSATQTTPYQATASASSNLGPSNPVLLTHITRRIHQLQSADPGNKLAVPVDLVTASASGLDPDISPAAAYYQLPRVAKMRGLEPLRLRELIDAQIQPRWLDVLGEPRVNVLNLNRALDDLAAQRSGRH